MTKYKSIYVFILTGLIAGLLAGLIGELLYLFSKRDISSIEKNIDIVLLADVSGSMKGARLVEMKNAINNLIDKKSPKDRMAIVAFSSSAHKIVDLSYDLSSAKDIVDSLVAIGGTEIDDALAEANSIFDNVEHENIPYVLLFTDGAPTCPRNIPIKISQIMKDKDINIVCVGAMGADINYLTQIGETVDSSNLSILEGFKSAMNIIDTNRNMMAKSRHGEYTQGTLTFLLVTWSVILSLLVLYAIISMQNHLLGNKLLTKQESLKIFFVAVGLGGLSVLFANILFSIIIDDISGNTFILSLLVFLAAIISFLASFKIKKYEKALFAVSIFTFLLGGYLMLFDDGFFLESISMITSWAVWCMALLFGVGFIIPNFDRKRSWWVGIIAGALSSIIFMIISVIVGSEGLSRFIVAGIIGAVIGMLVNMLKSSGLGQNSQEVEVVDAETGKSFLVTVGKESVNVASSLDGGVVCNLDEDGNVVIKGASSAMPAGRFSVKKNKEEL